MAEISERCPLPRWKPTAEQLQILEILYKNDNSTPTTENIHHIADSLRRYGEIQAKNVFYWFQNRRGNERVNKRRRLDEAMASDGPKLARITTGKLKTLSLNNS
ncbi:hypothetical protein SUGI_1177680 [Cryptomeria japonica]|nr:hypothetical protein SUGI_1177680 [Cryptomeria japonica]